MKKIKLLLAGSHAATTSYATIQEIKRQNLDWEIYFVGKKWATENKTSLSLEYTLLPPLGVMFYHLESGKIEAKFTKYTISAFLKIPFGFFKALFLFLKIKPQLTLSFGGASGAIMAFWSWVFGVPVVIHEQTGTAGRANIFASKFAKKVAVSRESSSPFFLKDKIVVTGNPINSHNVKLVKTNKKSVDTVLITGGSRGSEWINKAVFPILPPLLKKYKVIHQVGSANLDKYNLQHKNYQKFGQISIQEMLKTIAESDIVVARAGANTVSELIALKKPSILIPIPWSYNNEQAKNAEFARDYGIAKILSQEELKPSSLLQAIEDVVSNYPNIIKKVKDKESPDIHASKKLVDLLSECIK